MKYCPECGNKLSDVSKYCANCGEQLTKKSIASNSKSSKIGKVATNQRRFVNYLIDATFGLGIAYFIMFMVLELFGVSTTYMDESENLFWTLIAFVIYYFVLEMLSGKTLGKWITGTKVVDENGKKPEVNAILIRTLSRIVPFEPFSFISSDSKGWHDEWSKTKVVYDR